MTPNPHIHRYFSALIEEFRQFVQAADQPSLADILAPYMTQLQRMQFGADGLDGISVWVWIYGTPSSEEWRVIQGYFSLLKDVKNDAKNDVFVFEAQQFTVFWQPEWNVTDFDALAKSPAHLGLFWITENAQSDLAAVLDHISLCSNNVLIASAISELKWSNYLQERQRILSPLIRVETWSQLQNQSLVQDIAILQDVKNKELFQAILMGNELEKVNALAQQASQQIEFAIKIKRQQALQDDALLRSGKNVSTRSNELRNLFQVRFEQYERRTSDELENVLAPGGSLSKQLDAAIEQLPPLKEEKRAKNVIYAIQDDYKMQLLAYFAQQLRDYCREDIRRATDFAYTLDEQVRQYLSDHNLTLTLPPPALATESRLEEILSQIIRIERNYEGSTTKKKPMELMSGARTYLMMFMMLATMLGQGSELRKRPEYYLPFTVVMLGLGIWQYLINVQKENTENREKFSIAAKESLRSEFKRMLTDFSRQWDRVTMLPLKDWTKMAERETEAATERAEDQSRALKEGIASRTKNISESLRVQENNLQSALRTKASFDRSLVKNRSELAGLLRTQLAKFHSATPATDLENRNIR